MQSNLLIYTMVPFMIYTFLVQINRRKHASVQIIHYFYKMCVKGGGGQPLEAVGQALSDEQQSTEQSTVLYTGYTHSVMLPAFCERVSLDRLHADNELDDSACAR